MRYTPMINEAKVKRYCSEDLSLIENYDKAMASSEMWHCHHRREIEDGVVRTIDEMDELGLYYDRPASELIFLTMSEHRSLHGRNRSEYARNKTSEANLGHKRSIGRPSPMKGKHHSDEAKNKNRLAHIGKRHTDEWKRKMSERVKGNTYAKGNKNRLGHHFSEESKNKISESLKAYWERKRMEQATS